MSARSFRLHPSSSRRSFAPLRQPLSARDCRSARLDARDAGAGAIRGHRNDRRHGHAPRDERSRHPAEHRSVRRVAARSARDRRPRRARPQRAGPLRRRPRQALGQQHRRARIELERIPVGRVSRQQGRQDRRDVPRRSAVVCRPLAQRPRARRGAARPAGHAIRREHARRRDSLHSAQAAVRRCERYGARRRVLVERERQHGLARRRGVQCAGRRKLRVSRVDRSIRRPRLHRRPIPRAASRAFRTPSRTSRTPQT